MFAADGVHAKVNLVEAAMYSQLVNPTHQDPKTYTQAMASSQASAWQAAVDLEMATLEKYKAVALIPKASVPPNARILPSTMIFRTKFSNTGAIAKLKCRLVILGNCERPHVDYDPFGIYSPVCSYQVLLSVLSFATAGAWHIYQMDVQAAFLQGDELKTPVYAYMPKGLPDLDAQGRSLVMELHKSVYGLHQSPRWYYDSFVRLVLHHFQLQVTTVHPCLFVRHVGTPHALVMLIIVDDIISASPSLSVVQQFEAGLGQLLTMSASAPLNFYVSLEIDYNREARRMVITQKHHIWRMLEAYGMLDVTPVSTPMATSCNMYANFDTLPKLDAPAIKLYQQYVGSLLFLAVTARHDLLQSVVACTKFMSCPNSHHFDQVVRIMRYVAGTMDVGLTYEVKPGVPPNVLTVYVDSNHGGSSLQDPYNTYGYAFMFNNASVFSKCARFTHIVLSSGEGEYSSLCMAGKAAVHEIDILNAIGANLQLPIVIFEDNTAAIQMAANPTSTSRTRHISLQYHYVRELVQKGILVVQHLVSPQQLADIFTKPLSKEVFRRHRAALLNCELKPSRGDD